MDNIFISIITKINFKRKAYGNLFDGLAYWHNMRKILEKLPLTEYNWSQLIDTTNSSYLNQILDLPEKNELGNIILQNHCLIQLVRIPRKYPCNIMRVMHIAFNIGQFTALQESNYATLVKYELDDIMEYIDPDVAVLLNQIVITHPVIIDELLSI